MKVKDAIKELGIDANGNKKKYANPTWDTAKPVGDAKADDDEWPAA